MTAEGTAATHLIVSPLPVEEVPPGETAAIDAMIETLKEQLKKRYHDHGTTVLRDAHPKHHGLVMASFIVDSTCPVELRHGLFSRPDRRFDAVIRFSNGNPIVKHDLDGDLRGIAIKLATLPSELSVLGEAEQDFVMATGEAFFGKDAIDFRDFPKASESTPKTIWYFVKGLRLRGAWELRKARKGPRSPLDVEYFSQTPYRLGPHCVKYQVRPTGPRCAKNDPWYLKGGFRQLIGIWAMVLGWFGGWFGANEALRRLVGFHALRDSLARDLARGPVTLEFRVQRWPDLSQLPVWAIEDASRRWTASWVRVATIEIGQQHDISKRDARAEHMTFNPGRALAEHQALGGINRARLAIYREMSRFRGGLNQQTGSRP